VRARVRTLAARREHEGARREHVREHRRRLARLEHDEEAAVALARVHLRNRLRDVLRADLLMVLHGRRTLGEQARLPCGAASSGSAGTPSCTCSGSKFSLGALPLVTRKLFVCLSTSNTTFLDATCECLSHGPGHRVQQAPAELPHVAHPTGYNATNART
jgi:hypothetical protein